MTLTETMRAAMLAASRLPEAEQDELAERIMYDVRQYEPKPPTPDDWGGNAGTVVRDLRLVAG